MPSSSAAKTVTSPEQQHRNSSLRKVPDPPPPQTRRGPCDPVELSPIDKLPLLFTPDDERRILERHAEQLAANLLGPDGQAELRVLLAKRLAVIDVEVQRLSAVQEIILRKGTTRENILKARDINSMLTSAHRRFTATIELFHRLSAPRVTLSIAAAENVAVVDARRSG